MKVSKDVFIKQSWDFVTTTLKYLKDISGNPVGGFGRRCETFEKMADLLRKMCTLEELQIVENEFYNSKKYGEYDMTGKFLGFFTDDENFTARFEVLSGNASIEYRDTTDIINFKLEDLGNRNFDLVDITKEDLPLHMSKPFQGKLLENMLKEGKKK